MNNQILVSLVYSIYRTILEPERWPLILKECGELVGADACDLASYDFDRQTGEIIAHSGYYDDEFVRLYEGEYAASNPWLRQRHRYLLDGAIWVGPDLCPPERLIRTSFYNRWLRPQRLFHRCCSVICHDGVGAVYLSALRARGRDDFERHELHPVQKLVPHMRHVFELQSLLSGNRTGERQSLLQAAHRVHEAIRSAGPGNRIIEANSAGERLIAGRENRPGTGRLWSRINAALDMASGHGGDHDPGTAEPGEHSVSVIPLPPESTPGQAGPAAAVVGRPAGAGAETPAGKDAAKEARNRWRPLVIDARRAGEADDGTAEEDPLDPDDRIHSLLEPSDQAEGNAARLREIYGLTPAEARVAVLLVCGRSLQECAARLDVSITTVRTHLQRIFGKTDTHHQGELVAVLLAGPARLRIECVPVEEWYTDSA